MLFRLWYMVCGYVKIKLEGMGLERLLNRLDASGVSLWDIRRTGRTHMTACAPFFRLKRIERVAESCRCNVVLVRRVGIPARLYALLQRKMFIVCAVVAVAAVVVLSRFVWLIEIDGDQALHEGMLARLEEMQIRPGTPWSGIDTIDLQEKLMVGNEDAAFILVNREGTKMIVEIIPATDPPEYIENDRPCDIIASKDGVVVSVTALDGMPAVDVGQAVKMGDVLIKGEFINEQVEKSRTAAARGQVVAKVWYTGSTRIPSDEITRTQTGREADIKVLTLAGWGITVQDLPDDFGDYIIDTERKQTLSDMYLPATLTTTHVKEVQVDTAQREYSQAEQEGRRLAYDEAAAQLVSGTVVYDVQYSSQLLPSGEMEVYAFIQTEEDISQIRYHE